MAEQDINSSSSDSIQTCKYKLNRMGFFLAMEFFILAMMPLAYNIYYLLQFNTLSFVELFLYFVTVDLCFIPCYYLFKLVTSPSMKPSDLPALNSSMWVQILNAILVYNLIIRDMKWAIFSIAVSSIALRYPYEILSETSTNVLYASGLKPWAHCEPCESIHCPLQPRPIAPPESAPESA